MYNSELVQKIKHGLASPGQLREYVRRVARRQFPNHCEYGHENCALYDDGPCSLDCILAASRLDVTEVKSRPVDVKTKNPKVKTRGGSIFL